ncbi:unnamed protein product [Penicillium nalgiovense]|uniref:Uncharacterized protein n=1 Tax=Penicillium nalgiovense TaxID=60175 RepID=A0A9W4HTX0_PENNA|nr:unnamed protein product [Penicillium nalgiovense]CAG8008553.1 unnamed protein product [Penicillium nalgiovense]CAG8009711.1 unnamed protein product [Penicillium nalgiovense]CAG8010424.1 unnamed protein product [Penicillium nalgiovense]CAG8017224.1 unnamed protein product [Penicillium nalgiovense]
MPTERVSCRRKYGRRCLCVIVCVCVPKKEAINACTARPRKPKVKVKLKVKGAVIAAATLPYHPSPLSASDSFFLEKNETWLFTAQIANPAIARRRKRTMMMIAMVMLRWTILGGDDQQIVVDVI